VRSFKENPMAVNPLTLPPPKDLIDALAGKHAKDTEHFQKIQKFFRKAERERNPPLVYDLSKDAACVALLREIARKPWREWNWLVLADRVEEMGLDRTNVEGMRMTWVRWWSNHSGLNRRRRRRVANSLVEYLRPVLVEWYGDFEEIPF
jgi:hypothetical protein